MLSATPSAAFLAEGKAEDFCGKPVSMGCRTAWNITHSPDVTRWYHDWLDGDSLIPLLVKVVFTIVVALILRKVAHRMITRVMERMAGGPEPEGPGRRRNTIFEGSAILAGERRKQRAETIGSVLRSIASVVILTTAVLLVLGEFDINLAPFLASASIVGVAIGFGAQNLVKDFITGMFMLLEDQYGVGDWVDVGPATGTVEAMTLRITRLRDVDGAVWYVRNGEISRVGNSSQDWARAVVDVPVSYDEDVDRARRVMEHTAAELGEDPCWAGVVLEAPSVWGVEALSQECVVMRVVVKTAPLQQWAVGRDLRQRLKERLDEEHITVGSTFVDRDVLPPRRTDTTDA